MSLLDARQVPVFNSVVVKGGGAVKHCEHGGDVLNVPGGEVAAENVGLTEHLHHVLTLFNVPI